MLNLKPLHNNVIVDPEEKKTETSSGIYTGAYSTEVGLRRGTIVAVGDKVKELKEGDKICFLVVSGNIATFEGERYLRMSEDEVVGFINED